MAAATIDPDEALQMMLNIGFIEANAKYGGPGCRMAPRQQPMSHRPVLKNAKLLSNIIQVIQEAGAENGCGKAQGALLNAIATKFPANALQHRPYLARAVITGDIKANVQMDAALDFFKKLGEGVLQEDAFREAAGVGIEVPLADIAAAVAAEIDKHREALVEQRYHFNTGALMVAIRAQVSKWADGAVLRAEMEQQVTALLGPKTEADLAPKVKEKKKKEKKPATPKQVNATEPAEGVPTSNPYSIFSNPEDNTMVHTEVHMSDGNIIRIGNTAAELQAHLARTHGKVVTRFPPEPNGYLHIGHAKAMFVDFGLARHAGGVCYLRFDDTNPEAEEQEYIDHIQEIVSWLGWEPWKITYSSDYFQQLYDFAVQLIRDGKAFVCHQTSEEIAASREAKTPSPWRDRPVDESLKLFEDMRRGLVDEGKATLRLKMDYKNDNYNMFDLIAYRIKFTPHPHVGDTWCVYPSYDFTHCLVDALEDVTHSLCTLEFETRRASYYWLLAPIIQAVGTYKPLVWEYSRLNVTHNVMSKRKLQQLVTGKYVDGWDDPRLLTLAGLRRRGVSSQAVNNFIREIGITRNAGSVHLHLLDHHIRTDLDATAPRQLAVLRPLRVVIENFPEDRVEQVQAKVFPGRTDDTYPVPFSRVLYIEETDFRESDSKDYFGLAPNKAIMLRYAYPITCTSYTKDSSGRVVEVRVEYDAEYAQRGVKPPKGVVNWVAQPAPGQDPPVFEGRLYDVLFQSEEPAELDDWLADLNPSSKEVLPHAFANPALAKAAVGSRFQLERLGYFCVDSDSTPERLVLNRTCTLKESVAVANTRRKAA